jgi:hypothetical protein
VDPERATQISDWVSPYLTLPIRNFHDAGGVAMVRSPLPILTALLDRIGR